jgi:prepilin-type N-terminal cleavage/methylation domain-containing protein
MRYYLRNGFTLIEVLIALAITASVIGVTYTFYWFAYKNTLTGSNEIFMHKKLRTTLELLEKDIRNCKEIVKIEDSYLELKLFKDPDYYQEHVVLSEDDNTTTIRYRLKKGDSEHPYELQRAIDRAPYYTVMKFDEIEAIEDLSKLSDKASKEIEESVAETIKDEIKNGSELKDEVEKKINEAIEDLNK